MLNSTEDLAKTCTGSPLYMSPDVFKQKISYKSDIWSFGAILYQICNLRPPFEAQNFNALALKILKGSYPPIIQTYSKPLRDLINQMLSRNPSGRPTIVEVLNKPLVKSRVEKYVRETFARNQSFNPDIQYIHLDSLREQCQTLNIQVEYNDGSSAVSKDSKDTSSTQQVKRHPSTKDLISGNSRPHRVPPISKRGQEDDDGRPKRKSIHQRQSYSLQRNLKKKDEAASTASTRALNHISDYDKDQPTAVVTLDHREKVLQGKERKRQEDEKKQLEELKTIAHENEKNRLEAQARLQKQYRTRVQPPANGPVLTANKFKVQEDYRPEEEQEYSFDDDEDIIHEESQEDLDATIKASNQNKGIVNKDEDNEDEQGDEQDLAGEYNPTYYKLLDKIKVLRHRCETSIGSSKYKKLRKAVMNGEDRSHILELLGEDLVGYWHIVDEIMFMKSMLKIIPKK